MGYRNN